MPLVYSKEKEPHAFFHEGLDYDMKVMIFICRAEMMTGTDV